MDVQNFVIAELAAMRTSIEAMLITGRDYHWSRAQGLDKVLPDGKTEEKSSESTSTEDAKKTVKTDVSKSSTTVTPAGHPDYKEYIVSLDVRAYHAAYNQLTDLRDHFLKAHVLFAKNLKRLSDPRGEGEDGGRSHSMSMF